MSELESYHAVDGRISQRSKILIFAGIVVLLSLLVFGGITAILTSKHTSDKSTPTTAPLYYGNPVMDEDLTAAEKAAKALSDPNAPGRMKIDITVDKD